MKKMILVLVGCALGFLAGTAGTRNLDAYGEGGGSWSAGEKRQVISLLGQIARNTK